MVVALVVVLLVWSLGVVVTAIRVANVRADLADVAQEIAHHNAHSGGDDVAGRRYLAQRLRHMDRASTMRSASIRTIRGEAAAVEVSLSVVVGFAIGGHPKVRVSVTRSAPVEAASRLP